MICYKNNMVERAATHMRRDPKLSIMVAWWHDRYPVQTVITESWRPARHPGDLHSLIPYRAVDLRSWIFKYPDEVADEVNRVWIYDPQRPQKKCCVYHGEAKHFHLQVHPNTLKRSKYNEMVASGLVIGPVGGV